MNTFRYFYLSGTDSILRAKQQKNGLHCVKTTQGERQLWHPNSGVQTI